MWNHDHQMIMTICFWKVSLYVRMQVLTLELSLKKNVEILSDIFSHLPSKILSFNVMYLLVSCGEQIHSLTRPWHSSEVLPHSLPSWCGWIPGPSHYAINIQWNRSSREQRREAIPDLQPTTFPGELWGVPLLKSRHGLTLNRLRVFTSWRQQKSGGSGFLQSFLTSSKMPPPDISEKKCFYTSHYVWGFIGICKGVLNTPFISATFNGSIV